MKATIQILMSLVLTLAAHSAFARGRIQNEDVKSLTELQAAGATAANLINDTKVYVTANGINQQLSSAITNNLLAGGASAYLSPNTQTFTASGTYGLSYYFTISSGNATAGAVYTNNSKSFTVVRTISAGTSLLVTSTGAPTASGTLTKSSGTGDTTLTFSAYRAPVFIHLRLVGGGGGGGASGTASQGSGGAGGSTSFGSLCSGNGGSGGPGGNFNAGGGPGSGTVTAPAYGLAGTGDYGQPNGNGIANSIGGKGGSSLFGGGGMGGFVGGGGYGGTYYGGGGGGGGGSSTQNSGNGTGGGGGGWADCFVPNPAATYTVTVGAGGAQSTAGTNGSGGGPGLGGIVIGEDHFQ